MDFVAAWIGAARRRLERRPPGVIEPLQHVQAFLRSAARLRPQFAGPKDYRFEWLMYQSQWPWVELDLDVPHAAMAAEARALRGMFVRHREYDEVAGYRHKGWHSLCVHGLSAQQTLNQEAYGHKSADEAPYRYTEIAQHCPVTVRFLRETLGFEKYYRVRYMLLEPGGYVARHRDQPTSSLFPINIALNHPKGCRFGMENQGVLPFRDGKAFLLDLCNYHCVWNDSQEERYHLIVHGIAGPGALNYHRTLERSYHRILGQ